MISQPWPTALGSAPLVVRRTAAIGDALCATTVAKRMVELGHPVRFQTAPIIHCLLRLDPNITEVTVPGGFCHVDLDGAYENDPRRSQRHFHEMFFEVAGRQLDRMGISLGPPRNCRPRIFIDENNHQAALLHFQKYPKPWVFICPRSDTYNVRQVTDGCWVDIAKLVEGTKFWIGRHPAPPGIVDLKVKTVDLVVHYLSVADLLISVDTGPMHIAAALGVPVVAISQSSSPDLHLNDQNDYISVAPPLHCLNCQKNICPIDAHLPPCQQAPVELVAQWANARLRSISGNDVSAVVAIYQPDVQTLNRCLQSLIPQVSEIIVTRAADGILPTGALQHPKVRYVMINKSRIGYGRNVNHGARHTNGKYLLLVNDDVFLDPGAVGLLQREMSNGVGMVAHLLRYPDGRIYHAGVDRKPGMKDWYHIDHLQWHPTFQKVTELENACGTSVLVRREAFYRIGGFDEDFFLYSEDNDFALRIRQAGWKIIYTPFATGIHVGHLSSNKIGGAAQFIPESNRLFHSKWGRYLQHNLNKVPGDFNYV